MKEKELLDAMGEIKEEYVMDAAEAAENGVANADATAQNQKASKSKKTSWIVIAGSIAAVLAVCVGLGTLFSGGMGSSSSELVTMNYADASAEAYEEYGYGSYSGASKATATAVPEEAYYESDEVYYEATDNAYSGATNNAGVNSADVQRSESKLIKRAYMTVQTLDFEESEAAIKALVEDCEGYFESSSMYNGGIYDTDYNNKSADYTIRVPAENYSKFMNAVGNSCYITDINENVEDIGEEYFDVENRLKTLNTKLTRLQELLAKAENMTDIVTIESEISDVEYEIDSYTSTLNRYDSLVGYSTINISLYQVSRVEDTVQQDNRYIARLWRSLKNGLANFVDAVGDIISWAAFNLVTIIIIVVAIILIRKYHLVRRLINAIKRR